MSLETRQQVARAVKAIEGKKGEDIVILEMDRDSGAFTDYFVVCSGTNPRQLQAIADDVQKQLEEMGQRPNSVEGYNQAEWVLLDYVDFVLHIFSERARKFYDLERLWKSARKLSPADLAKKPSATAKLPAAKKKAAAKKTPAKKKAVAPRKPARTKTAARTKTKKKPRKSA
jgi:ribosome-associated protein